VASPAISLRRAGALTEARQELLHIRQGILNLMDKFRRELGGKDQEPRFNSIS
jgi:hypothetical protein